MMIPIERATDAAARKHACALLGVATDADRDECRRAALLQIDAADYGPTAAWHDAVDVLFSPYGNRDGAGSRSAPSALCAEAETQLSERIEEFAANLFGLEPDERRRRCEELRWEAMFSPRMSRRLGLLAAGLDITPPAVESPGLDRQSQLIRWALTMFPLRPAARSDMYLLARDAMRDAPLEWEFSAQKFAQARPDLAQLAPDVMGAVREHRLEEQAIRRQIKNRRREARRQLWARWRSAAGLKPGGGLFRVLVVSLLWTVAASLSRVDFREKKPPPSVGRVFRQFQKSRDLARSMPAADLHAIGRKLGNTTLDMLSWQATDTMPTAERNDVMKRLSAGRKLTEAQFETIQRTLRDRGQEGLARDIREFQAEARADDPSAATDASGSPDLPLSNSGAVQPAKDSAPDESPERPILNNDGPDKTTD